MAFSLLFPWLTATGQNSGKPAVSPLDTRIPEFTLEGESILSGVQKLNKEGLGLNFGFERILARNFSDPEIPYAKITLRLENASARQVLDGLCAADPRYTWSSDGRAINVYPRVTLGNSTYLMNRELKIFRLQNLTKIDQGLLAIVRQLPPPVEQVAHVQVGAGGGECPPAPWTAVFKDITVRQALNRLVAHIGANASWIFYGSQEFREFAFYQGPVPHQLPVSFSKLALTPGAPVVSHLMLQIPAFNTQLANGNVTFTGKITLDNALASDLPVTFTVLHFAAINPSGVELTGLGSKTDVEHCSVTHIGGICSVSFHVASLSTNTRYGRVSWQFLYSCNCRDAAYRTSPNPLVGTVTFGP